MKKTLRKSRSKRLKRSISNQATNRR